MTRYGLFLARSLGFALAFAPHLCIGTVCVGLTSCNVIAPLFNQDATPRQKYLAAEQTYQNTVLAFTAAHISGLVDDEDFERFNAVREVLSEKLDLWNQALLDNDDQAIASMFDVVMVLLESLQAIRDEPTEP